MFAFVRGDTVGAVFRTCDLMLLIHFPAFHEPTRVVPQTFLESVVKHDVIRAHYDHCVIRLLIRLPRCILICPDLLGSVAPYLYTTFASAMPADEGNRFNMRLRVPCHKRVWNQLVRGADALLSWCATSP